MATPETKVGRVCRPVETEHLIVGDRRLGACTQCARVAKKGRCNVLGAFVFEVGRGRSNACGKLEGSSRAAGE